MNRSAPGSPIGGGTAGVPLTERILSRLPGPRLAWVLVWALVPWVNLVAVRLAEAAEWTGPRTIPVGEVLDRTAVSGAILLSLWGAARITDNLRTVGAALTEVVEQDEGDVRALFRGMDSTIAPLLLTAAAVLVLPLDEALTGEPRGAAIRAVTWVIIGIPLWTAVWVYLTLQLGFDRLGRGHLTLQGYRGDRSLGLRPVGRLAFTGFWVLIGTVGPLVLTNVSEIPGVILGIAVLLVGVGLFFLSLRRLNRKMAGVKQRELNLARDLYMQAYQKVRDQPTLEALQGQVGLLNAAEALEKRAERIQEWPFDEATFARVITIASSAAATIIARFLLDPIGL